MVTRRLALSVHACGTVGAVHIVPNWHDMVSHAVPFSVGWKS